MNNLQLLNNTNLSMTLKEITDLLEVRHNDAMKTVERMSKSKEFGDVTKISYRTEMGNTYETYELNKIQSLAVAAKLNTDLLVRVIKRLEELEQEKSYGLFKLPSNYEEALEDLLVKVKENKVLEKQVEFLEPFKETVDGSKVIFPKKESVYDQERGFKKHVKELCPYLSNDKITNILEFYTTKKYKNTDYYVKGEIQYCVQKFIEDSEQEIRGTKKSVILYHKCLPGGKTIVNKDYAIQYLGKREEDFE
jgi:hypothetical protein